MERAAHGGQEAVGGGVEPVAGRAVLKGGQRRGRRALLQEVPGVVERQPGRDAPPLHAHPRHPPRTLAAWTTARHCWTQHTSSMRLHRVGGDCAAAGLKPGRPRRGGGARGRRACRSSVLITTSLSALSSTAACVAMSYTLQFSTSPAGQAGGACQEQGCQGARVSPCRCSITVAIRVLLAVNTIAVQDAKVVSDGVQYGMWCVIHKDWQTSSLEKLKCGSGRCVGERLGTEEEGKRRGVGAGASAHQRGCTPGW